MSVVRGRALLTYDTGRAKGSIQIPTTRAELTYFAQRPNQPSPVWDASYVAIVLVTQQRYDGPLGTGGGQDQWYLPMSWRILVAPLDANGKPSALSVFATGRSTLDVGTPNFECGECSGGVDDWPPNVALSGGLIAYNVEQPTKDHPFGSEILLRSLTDGSTVRDLATPEYVYSLELSGTNLVWIEYPGITTYTLPLRISTATHPQAQDLLVYQTPGDSGDVEWNVPPYFLEGTLLTWQASTAGKIWQRDLGTSKLRQISPDGLVCQLDAFDGSNIVMGCASPEAQPGDPPVTAWDSGFLPDWFVFWSPVAGYRVLTGTPDSSGSWSAAFANGSLWLYFTPDQNPYETDVWTAPLGTLAGN
jgi:hypothetical protein